ncbi:hypothetical protein [Myxococcus stipitatus]|uniref:hypothetical protein n=1 Tax=Myxococcus stipitatus TaxID=83455 RepID=UPI0030CDEA44
MASCMYEVKALEDVPAFDELTSVAAGPEHTPVPDESRHAKKPGLPMPGARPDVRDPPPDPEPGVTQTGVTVPEPKPRGT